MTDIVHFGPTIAPISPEKVLSGALSADLADVLVIGTRATDGSLYVASCSGDKGGLLFALELAKRAVMDGGIETGV